MKIKVEEGLDKPFLTDGRHEVEITHIDEGKSEYKGVPFIACRFENEDGFVTQRFYLSTGGMPRLMELCQAAGIKTEVDKELDTNQLIGRKMAIEVGDQSYSDPETGDERRLKQALSFEALA